MTDYASKVKKYRKLAADARTAAQSMTREDSRKSLLSIADTYDVVAAGLESHNRKSDL